MQLALLSALAFARCLCSPGWLRHQLSDNSPETPLLNLFSEERAVPFFSQDVNQFSLVPANKLGWSSPFSTFDGNRGQL